MSDNKIPNFRKSISGVNLVGNPGKKKPQRAGALSKNEFQQLQQDIDKEFYNQVSENQVGVLPKVRKSFFNINGTPIGRVGHYFRKSFSERRKEKDFNSVDGGRLTAFFTRGRKDLLKNENGEAKDDGDANDELEDLRLFQKRADFTLKYEGHVGRVNDIDIDAGGKLLYTVGEDKTLKIWLNDKASVFSQIQFEKVPLSVKVADAQGIVYVAVPNESENITDRGRTRMCVSRIDIQRGVILDSRADHCMKSSPVCITPCGKFLYTVVNKYGEVFDLHGQNNCVGRFPPMGRGGVDSILVSNCGKYVFTCENLEGKPGVVKSYETETTRCVTTFAGHETEVTSVAQSADGKYIYTCGQDAMAYRFDTGIEQKIKKKDVVDDFYFGRSAV